MSQTKKNFLLSKGCLLGLALSVLLVVLCLVGLVLLIRWQMGVAAENAKVQLVSLYDEAKSDGVIADNNEALFAELQTAVEKEDATFWTVSLVTGCSAAVLKDGKLSETEIAELEAIRGLIADNPRLGYFACLEFLQDNPEIMAKTQVFAQEMTQKKAEK